MKRINILIDLLKSTDYKLNLLKLKRQEYHDTKEYNQQKKIDDDISQLSKQVAQNLKEIREKMRVMEIKLKDISQQREDQINSDTDIRMMKTVLNCF